MSKDRRPSLDRLDPASEWAPWQPSATDPWSPKWAAHLYRRAGFGPTRGELREAVSAGLEPTLDKLFAAPTEPRKREPVVYGPPPINRTTGMADATGQAAILRAAWVGRLIDGTEPLREKLALFWHNHFATGIQKVNDGALMERQ